MRSLSREARHERRAQVIRLREANHTYDEIAALTGLGHGKEQDGQSINAGMAVVEGYARGNYTSRRRAR